MAGAGLVLIPHDSTEAIGSLFMENGKVYSTASFFNLTFLLVAEDVSKRMLLQSLEKRQPGERMNSTPRVQ
jgi:hypothetical protein